MAAHAHNVTEEQHGALLVRQLGHGGREVALTPWGRTSGEKVVRNAAMQVLGATLSPPELVETTKADASVQPGLKRPSVTANGGSSLHELEKGLLDGIFAGGLVAEDRIGKRVETVGDQLVEIAEGIGREPTHPFEECVQLGVVGVTSDSASWVLRILLGIGVTGSQMNVISFLIGETVPGLVCGAVLGGDRIARDERCRQVTLGRHA